MTDHIKLAALKIASMNPNDQKWIFGQLPSEHVKKIQPLVVEIEQLGIENIDELVKELAPSTPKNTQKAEQELLARWSTTAFEDLESELQALPRSLLILLCAVYNWPWLEQAITKFKLKSQINPNNISASTAVINQVLAQCRTALGKE